MSTVSALVSNIRGLVTLPHVYLHISRLVDNPESSIANIAKGVSQDASFTLRLLRVANSALYRVSSNIDTVAKAISIVGTAHLRNLALSMSVASSFAGLPNELVSMENFWRHSLYCALTARHLAKRMGRCDPDALFTAGLVHDIGELIIFNRLPEQARQALMMVLESEDGIDVYQAERQVMGFDHGVVGGELAKAWRLPSLLEACIAHHHDLAGGKKHRRATALVHLANNAALMAELDTVDPDNVPPIDPIAWERTGLTTDCMEHAVREAQAEIAEAERLFTEAC